MKEQNSRLQSRAQVLTKQLHDHWEQIEQAHLELSTFKFLQAQEEAAVPRRINGLMDDVNRQTEREKVLQSRFSELQDQLQELQLQWRHGKWELTRKKAETKYERLQR